MGVLAFLNEALSWGIASAAWFLAHQCSRYRGLFAMPAAALCSAIGVGTLFVVLFRQVGESTFIAVFITKLALCAFLALIAWRIHKRLAARADQGASAVAGR